MKLEGIAGAIGTGTSIAGDATGRVARPATAGVEGVV
jgi:hypothetical protein